MKITQDQIQEIKAEIEKIVKSSIPENCYFYIKHGEILGYNQIYITIAANDRKINNVNGQYPQRTNLVLNLNNMELKPSGLGGMGGQCIYRKIDSTNPKESYLAMARIKIPFRLPKKDFKYIYPAIERYCKKWVELIKQNKSKLVHQDITDNYSMFD